MVINNLCFRKSFKNEAKSSLTRLIFNENKASKKDIINCISDSYGA